MSFRWLARPDDDDEDDEFITLGVSDDLNEAITNLILQIDYVIDEFQTIATANPESPEYEDAMKYIIPVIRGLDLTIQEFITAIHANDDKIDQRHKERLFLIISEITEYFDQLKNREISIHGFIQKLNELKQTVEKLKDVTATQLTVATDLPKIIQYLNGFKQLKNGGSLALAMENFESKWKPVIPLIADEWAQLESFIELPTLQFINPRNKERFNQIIDAIIAKLQNVKTNQ
jgi:hypothetical protein